MTSDSITYSLFAIGTIGGIMNWPTSLWLMVLGFGFGCLLVHSVFAKIKRH